MSKPQTKGPAVPTTLDLVAYGVRREGKMYKPVRVELYRDGSKKEVAIHEPVVYLAVAFEYISSAILAHYQQITAGKEKAP